MDTQTIIEIVGYIGSFLVLVSFLMTSVFKLRIVNTIGSFIFMVYALIIKSYPTAIMNFCLVLINLRFLYKMSHTEREFELVEVKNDDSFLSYFLNKNAGDIKACFPGISLDTSAVNKSYLVSCEGNPVGVTYGKENSGEFDIMLDYTTKEYRDFSIGSFLNNQLKEKGIKKLIYSGPTENHLSYLEKMGYTKEGEHYTKAL